jgi:hypothetical protein
MLSIQYIPMRAVRLLAAHLVSARGEDPMDEFAVAKVIREIAAELDVSETFLSEMPLPDPPPPPPESAPHPDPIPPVPARRGRPKSKP